MHSSHIYVKFAYNNSVKAATVFAPDEILMGRLQRFSLTILERARAAGNQSLALDHLAYCDLATDPQQRAYDIVREHYTATVVRVNHRNSALSDALRSVPEFAIGGWAWV